MRLLIFLTCLIPKLIFAQSKNLKIDIHLKGVPDGILFFLNEDKVNIDSAYTKNQEIHFNYQKNDSKPKGLLIISSDNIQGYIVWAENQSMVLNGVYEDLNPLSTKQSQTQNEFREYMMLTSSIEDSLSELTNKLKLIQLRKETDTSKYINEIRRLADQLKKFNIDFFKKNPNSIISTMSLFFESTHKRFTQEEVMNSFKQLSIEQQNSPEGQGILKSIELFSNPVIGSKAPFFKMNDINGNLVKSSDFEGKNIVLIFWASWCGPCLKEMPLIHKAYNELKDKNVVFICISLDETSLVWRKAVLQNSSLLINLSDLKGWMNEAALIYGVTSIPNNFLIDKNGILVEQERGISKIKDRLLLILSEDK